MNNKALKKISIIIPHFNGEEILVDCLNSIYKTCSLDLDIILVDNGSTDNSVALVEQQFPSVIILKQEENLGFAGGCNAGVKHASTPYVLILNNDTVHDPGWIDYLLEQIESDDNISAVQPKLRSFQNREKFDYSGAAGGEIDIFGFPFARGRIFDKIENDLGQYDSHSNQIFWASGTAFLARRDVMLRAGLFDEDFFAHMEEIDLDWRMQLMGYKIVVEPKAIIYHRSGYTLGAESSFKKYLNHRNALFMFLSNYRTLLTCYLFPMRIALDLMAMIFSLIKLDFGRFVAIIKAHFNILLHPKKIIRKRKLVKSLRKVGDEKIMLKMYKGSIAISALLFGKRDFFDN